MSDVRLAGRDAPSSPLPFALSTDTGLWPRDRVLNIRLFPFPTQVSRRDDPCECPQTRLERLALFGGVGVRPRHVVHVPALPFFLRLSDVASGLPPYEERVLLSSMDTEEDASGFSQRSAHDSVFETLRAALTEVLAKGSKRLLATYLQTLLAYPDGCTRGETVFDLVDFPTICWYETDYGVYTMRQASRRSWRIGQTEPVQLAFMTYRNTLQADALKLVAQKLQSSLAV